MTALTEFLSTAFQQATSLGIAEAIAVALAMAYIIFAIKESLWCWPAAFLSTAIYTWLFWEVSLLMESVLNVYYMAMAVYGYWHWRANKNAHQDTKPVVSWSLARHGWIIGISTLGSIILGYLMATYTQAHFPWLDAATTVFAVVTTWLVAQKVLENWLYWIVIDAASIYLYIQKDLMLTAALFLIYIVLAAIGYLRWQDTLPYNSDQPSR
ncbi:nicotinamide riboside transporter PnuC [Simiduia sp. 21SJ11W-1]|uniref:nicotinamide riboside transporter PnuC n=1 Tax=Simiduia sp. 21SJ11W-1 TaxID=2909669 RepID=UPI0020A1D931|nr:nicotinamide riboside transporter PnuC [Simiduia sp. 21SJ11W-1]UTA47139.1 nicotinamide riboside transporter PnuC [Simiduia sp. 21SJ11W-1]